MAAKLENSTPFFVRFRDTDAMGHVNNAVYLSYLEVARMSYWKRLTGITDFKKVDFILARAEVDYRFPAKTGDELVVYTRISRIGGSSFDFEYRIEEKPSGRLIAEAKTVMACFDYSKGKVKRMDPALREKIKKAEGL
ncbi:MAG: thioesterase family protein [Elusimicrobiota bacterium]